MFHSNILNRNQKAIITKLILPQKYGFYLAGGTALALQLGHRTSIDFDFYSLKNFPSLELVRIIAKTFLKTRILFQAEDTLRIKVADTELSFFYYPYRLIDQPLIFQKIQLASLADIAAMKLAAIVQRGTRRDFIDVYYLLANYQLEQLIDFTIKKYPGFQPMLILRGLLYLEDADNEKFPRPIQFFDPAFSWEKAKEKIFAEVKKYQLAMIKKH